MSREFVNPVCRSESTAWATALMRRLWVDPDLDGDGILSSTDWPVRPKVGKGRRASRAPFCIGPGDVPAKGGGVGGASVLPGGICRH